jgi:hypothetical protein
MEACKVHPTTILAERVEHQKVTKVLDWRAVMAG